MSFEQAKAAYRRIREERANAMREAAENWMDPPVPTGPVPTSFGDITDDFKDCMIPYPPEQAKGDGHHRAAVGPVACPRDTNGDGDCGKPNCPSCGPGRTLRDSSTRAAAGDTVVEPIVWESGKVVPVVWKPASEPHAWKDLVDKTLGDLARRSEQSILDEAVSSIEQNRAFLNLVKKAGVCDAGDGPIVVGG